MNLSMMIPLVMVPAGIAVLTGICSLRIVPLAAIPYATALVGLAIASFGFFDRARYATDDNQTFAKRIMFAYVWIVPWALGGWLIAQTLWINPPWTALLGIAIGVYKARKILGQSESPERPQTQVQRGPELRDYQEVRKEAEMRSSRSVYHLLWGGVPVPDEFAHSHFLVCGTTGSGKTKTIQMLMESVVRTICKGSDSRALIYDSKGDMFPYLAAVQPNCPVKILNPLDQRAVAWDIAADFTSAADFPQLVHALCPDAGEGHDRFYPKATRALLQSLVVALSRRAKDQWTLSDLIYLANLDDSILKKLFGVFPDLQQFMANVFKARELPGVRISLTVELDRYTQLAGAWKAIWDQGPKRRFSLNNWPNDESILLLPNRPEHAVVLTPFNQLFIRILSSRVLAQTESDTRDTWLFLDELADLGSIPQIPELLAKGRSKGLCAVVGFQELAGLKNPTKGYGEHDAARLIGQCNHQAFLRCGDSETAKWASGRLGEQERILSLKSHQESRHSDSEGESQHIERVSIVLPSQIENLPLCTRANGLHGFYLAPWSKGGWGVTLPADFISGAITAPAPSVPEFVPHDVEYSIKSWDKADLKRLNLEFLFEDEGEGETTPHPDPPKSPTGENRDWQIPRMRKPPPA